MVPGYSLLGVCYTLITLSILAHCQSFEHTKNDLHDMIQYARQTEQRRLGHQQTPVATEKFNNNDDRAFRKPFNKFLLEYIQVSGEQQQQQTKEPFSTPSTTQAPVHSFPTVTETPLVQRRRLPPRRKINNPEASTPKTIPFSSLLGHVTEPTITIVMPLRKKSFGNNSKTTAPQIFPLKIRNTTTTQANPIKIEKPIEHEFKEIPQILVKTALKDASEVKTIVILKESKVDKKEFKSQAESAQYGFASYIDDKINDNFHQREEVRNGLEVRGKYSYSDGYYKRTVYYEADDKGYRVIKEEVEPLNGPHIDPDGHAKVSSYVAGNSFNYEISKNDIRKKD